MSAEDDYPELANWDVHRNDRWEGARRALDEIDRLRAENEALIARRDEVMRSSGRAVRELAEAARLADPESELGYVIYRARGGTTGPFSTRSAAEHYLQPGDQIALVNEHGNVIDYGPQFGEDDDTPPPKCPGCLLNAYADDKGTVMRRGRRWHWSCIPRVRT